MVGNSAAIQANILVPGMAGTHSSVKIGPTASSTHAAGVGYQKGEPYAKWGRFACEMPTSCFLGRDAYAREEVRDHPSLNSPRQHPRFWGRNEADANVGQDNNESNGNRSCVSGRGGAAVDSRDGVAAHLDGRENEAERCGGRDATRTPTIPSVRGGPAYLEVTMHIRGAGRE